MRERQHGGAKVVRLLGGLVLGPALVAGAGGCTHNYYYGASACPPVATTPALVEYGSVCDVPSQVVSGGTVVAGKPLNTTPVLGGPRPPRVVVSSPGTRPGLGWRRADDAGLATTRVDGAVDEPTLTR